jgi:hypothetical protein
MNSAFGSRSRQVQRVPLWLFFFFASWVTYSLVSAYPGYVHEDPAEIAMWSSLGLHWGYVKHPPLLPWIVTAMTQVVPVSWVSLSVLAAANLTVAAGLVWALAARTIGPQRAPLALALFCLSPYTTIQAIKLNHNSILLSLWPLATLAFLALVRTPSVASGVWLGIAAALAVYAKYSSALLLLGFAMAAVVSSRRMAIFTSPAPYIAVGVFAALLAPHALWMRGDGFSTVAYAAQALAPVGVMPLGMLGSNLAGFAPMLAGFAVLLAAARRSHHSSDAERPDGGALLCLAVIAITAYVLTLAATMALGLRASHTWTMPVFAFIPVLLAAALSPLSAGRSAILARAGLAAAILLPAGGAIGLAVNFHRGALSPTDPQAEFANDVEGVWATSMASPLEIVAGDHRYVMAANVALPSRPAVWPFGEQAPWITPDRVKRAGMIVVCRDGLEGSGCRTEGEKAIAGDRGWVCALTRHRTLWGMAGPLVSATAYFVPPAGHTVHREVRRCPD